MEFHKQMFGGLNKMPQYETNMRGVLFKNDKKETDNHPDYKGKIEINHEEFWLSAWIKTDKNGNKYMSLSVQEKEAQKDNVSF